MSTNKNYENKYNSFISDEIYFQAAERLYLCNIASCKCCNILYKPKQKNIKSAGETRNFSQTEKKCNLNCAFCLRIVIKLSKIKQEIIINSEHTQPEHVRTYSENISATRTSSNNPENKSPSIQEKNNEEDKIQIENDRTDVIMVDCEAKNLEPPEQEGKSNMISEEFGNMDALDNEITKLLGIYTNDPSTMNYPENNHCPTEIPLMRDNTVNLQVNPTNEFFVKINRKEHIYQTIMASRLNKQAPYIKRDTSIIQHAKINKASRLVGLSNQKNNCYLNCIIQLLRNTPEFNNTLQSINNTGNDYLDEIKEIIVEMNETTETFVDTKRLSSLKNPVLDLEKQQDAHEILMMVLEGIIEAEIQEKGESKIQETIEGLLQNNIVNASTNYRNIVPEKFNSLAIHLKYEGLKANIEDLTTPKKIEDKINNTELVKTTKFLQTPNILILQLLRFDWSGNTITKNNSVVNFQEKLTISTPSSNSEYALKAVIIHHGVADNGHYKIVIRDVYSLEWILYDDREAKIVTEHELYNRNCGDPSGYNSSNAYILIYSRTDNPSSSDLLNIVNKNNIITNSKSGMDEKKVFTPSDSDKRSDFFNKKANDTEIRIIESTERSEDQEPETNNEKLTEIEKIQEDGNCLTRSLLRALQINQEKHPSLRKLLSLAFQRNLNGIQETLKEEVDKCQQTIKLETLNTPLGLLAILLFADIARTAIRIHDDRDIETILKIIRPLSPSKDSIAITYNPTKKHYNTTKGNKVTTEIKTRLTQILDEIDNKNYEDVEKKYGFVVPGLKQMTLTEDLTPDETIKRYNTCFQHKGYPIPNCVLGGTNQLFANFTTLRANVKRKNGLIPKGSILNFNNVSRIGSGKIGNQTFIGKLNGDEMLGGGAKKQLSFFAYNARSINEITNLRNLQLILEKEIYDVVLINETWIPDKLSCKLKTNLYQVFIIENSKGGAGILVHRSLRAHNTFQYMSNDNLIVVKINADNPILVFASYIPPPKKLLYLRKQLELLTFLTHKYKEATIIGYSDYNIQRESLGDYAIFKELPNLGFRLLYSTDPEAYTWKGANNKKKTYIDYMIYKGCEIAEFAVEYRIDISDHHPITTKLALTHNLTVNTVEIINLNSVKNDPLQTLNLKKIFSSQTNHTLLLNDYVQYLRQTYCTYKTKKYTTINQSIKSIGFLKKTDEVKKKLCHLKKTNFLEFLNILNDLKKTNQTKSYYKQLRWISKKGPSSNGAIVDRIRLTEDRIETNQDDVVKMLIGKYKDYFQDHEGKKIYTERHLKYMDITHKDIEAAIRKVNTEKAISYDCIYGKFAEEALKNDNNSYDETCIQGLKKIFQSWMEQGSISANIATNRLLCLSKVSNDIPTINDIRPIALCSYILKIFDQIFLDKLNREKKSKNFSNSNQIGFEEGFGCLINLLRLVREAKTLRKANKTVFILLSDFKGAFDSLIHLLLFEKMANYKIKAEIINTLKLLLSSLRLMITQDKTKTEINQNRGVGQGMKSSPAVFNLYMNDLIDMLERIASTTLGYADDLSNLTNSIETLRKLINLIRKWGEQNEILLNNSKSGVIIIEGNNNNWQMDSIEGIPIVESYKYLGVVINNKMTLKDHIDRMKIQIRDTTNKLTQLSAPNMSISEKIELWNVYLVSKILYGACAFTHDRIGMNELKKLYYMTLKRVLRIHKTTSNVTLIAVLKIQPFEHRINLALNKVLKKYNKRFEPLARADIQFLDLKDINLQVNPAYFDLRLEDIIQRYRERYLEKRWLISLEIVSISSINVFSYWSTNESNFLLKLLLSASMKWGKNMEYCSACSKLNTLDHMLDHCETRAPTRNAMLKKLKKNLKQTQDECNTLTLTQLIAKATFEKKSAGLVKRFFNEISKDLKYLIHTGDTPVHNRAN